MKKKFFIFFMVVFVIGFFSANGLEAQVIGIQWNTFLGSTNADLGYDITSDSAGNIYVTGISYATWGSPINAYTAGYDVFVAKLDSNGNLVWNTFLGSSNHDYGQSITLDSVGNICITGHSFSTWGSPINPHSGGDDAFVAKLDSNGNLTWNTFLGGGLTDYGYGITSDSGGNIFVTGNSYANWGSPINPHSAGFNFDAFVAKLDTNGNLLWNTFFGCIYDDYCYSITSGSSGNFYAAGLSHAAWGIPINAFAGGYDAFVSKLDTNGNLLWHTFLGSSAYDYCHDITSDSAGNISIIGVSDATWGSPINPFDNFYDAFVAKLDNNGNLLWNTFVGGSDYDHGSGITSDNAGNLYATGYSDDSWGNPINPYAGSFDAFVTGLDSNGTILWNTFLGSADEDDYGNDISSDSSGNVYVTGDSYISSWGNPINPHAGDWDAFVVKITLQPIPDIKANGSDGPISITQSDTLQIRISLNTNGITDNADFWLAYKGPSGWYHYNKKTKSWESGLDVTHQGTLFDLNNKKVFQASGLSPGTYRFYFGVDMNMNGKVSKSCLYSDMVKVTVTN